MASTGSVCASQAQMSRDAKPPPNSATFASDNHQQMELPSHTDAMHQPSTSDDSERGEGDTSIDCAGGIVRRQTPSIGGGSSSTKANRRVALRRIFNKSNTSLDRQPKAQIVAERVLPSSVSMKGCRLVQVNTLALERPLLVAVEKRCQVWDIFTLVMDHLSIADDCFFGLAIRQPAEGIGTDRPRHEYYFLDFDAPFTKYLPKSPRFSSIRKALHHYYLQLRENFIDHWSGPNSVREERCWLLASTALQADMGLENSAVSSGPSRADKLTFRAEQYLPLWVIGLHGLDFIRENMPALTRTPASPVLFYGDRDTCKEHMISFCEEASREPFSLNCHLYSLRRHRSDLMENALFAISDRGIDMWSVGDGGERIALRSLEWKSIEQLSFERKKVSVGGVNGVGMSLYAQSDQRAKYLLEFCKSVHKQLLNIKMNHGANSKLYSRGWAGQHRIAHSVDVSASQTPTISSRLTTPEMRHLLVPSSASTVPIGEHEFTSPQHHHHLSNALPNGSSAMSNVTASKSPVFSPRVWTPVTTQKLPPSVIESQPKMINGVVAAQPQQQGSGQKQRMFHKGGRGRRNHHAIGGTDSPTLNSSLSTFGAEYETPRHGLREESAVPVARALESSEALQLENALNAAPSPPRMPGVTVAAVNCQEKPSSVSVAGSAMPSGNGMPPSRIRPIIKQPPKIRQPPQYFEAIEHLNRRPHPLVLPPVPPPVSTAMQQQIPPPPHYPYQQLIYTAAHMNGAISQAPPGTGHAPHQASHQQQLVHLPPSPIMKPQPMASQKRPLIPAATVKRTVEQFQARYPTTSSDTTAVPNVGTEQPAHPAQNLDAVLINGLSQATTTAEPPQSLPNGSSGVGRSREKGDVKTRRAGAASKSPSHRTAVRVNRVKSMPSSSVAPPERRRPPPPQYNEAMVAEERKMENAKHSHDPPPTPTGNGAPAKVLSNDGVESAVKLNGEVGLKSTVKWINDGADHVLAVENGICARFNTENLEHFPMLKALYLETKNEGLSGQFQPT